MEPQKWLSAKLALICSVVALLSSSISAQNINGELRLVDNNGITGGSSGRLEVNINGTWGTVCDDSFDSFDAEVACRQLGFSEVVNFGNVGQLGFTQGDSTQPIYLDDLGCGGTELLLINCPHNGIGNHNCGHGEDVALQCVSSTPTPFTTPTPFPVGGELRLVDNNGITGGSSGRLEVNINGTWGTVCDDSFDSFDAEVACRQLGFTGVVNFGNVGQLGFTEGDSTQPIYLDDLGCGGTELLLINCPHNGIGNHNCGHSEDVALQCVSSTPTPFTTPTPFPVGGELRLVDNNGITGGSSGRLEVNINGTWGTVCDDSFDSFDAEVACRQLGFSGVVNFGNVGQLGFAQGDSTQPIYLDDLGCGGTELLLINCPHNGIGNHNCGHNEDVALQCVSSTPTPFTTPTPFPVSGDLRLVDNNGITGGSSGRLEVNINGTWGTVCDDSFDSFDAEVACRQLGFSGVVNFGNVGQLGFAQGDSTQPIYLDDLGCGGTELLLINCPHNGIGNHNCGHNEDVALQCVSSTPTPFTTPTTFPVGGELRLVDNNGTTGGSSGRLEVNINGTWGTVCDDSFDSFDAEVACRQLGFSGVVNFGNVGQLGFAQGDSTQPIYLDDLGCGGTELLLINCPHNGIGNHNCGHNEDVALQCVSSTPTPFTTPTPFPVGGDLRLVDNNGITGGSSGRLEVNINGTWGTVCDDSFDSFDAEVACRQLGFSGVVNFGNVGQLGFAQGDSTQPIYLDDLGCGGTELLLINCPHNGIGNHNCGHNEDVALQCVSSTPTPFTTPTPFPVGGELRLVDNNGTTGGSSGRLEVNINGTWGTVCDDSFDSFDAEVACRQLGFSGVVNFGNVGQLGFAQGDSTQPIYLDDLGCGGTELLLINCPHNGIGNHNCGHNEDVALQCVSSTPTPFTTPTPFPVGGELRLVDNNGTTGGSSGRLEVNINGTWGTVCDDSFDSFDAEVACRQLGFSGVVNFGNVGQLGFAQGDSTQPIYLDDLGCGGTELLLINCPHNGIGNHNCGHNEDVALQCVSSTPTPFTTPTPFPVGGDLRLVDNNGITGGSSGRLEVNINGTWGTVCDDSFDSFDAEVACRQLGFSGVVNFGNVGQLGFTEGDSTQPIYLDDLGCGGTELLLINCPHNGIGNHNCGHSEDVALQCVSSTPTPFTTPTPFPVGGELRLVDNNGTTGGSSGRLEVNINGTWGTVCDDSFDSFDAEVACRQLGFSGVVNFGNVGQLGFAQGDSTQPIYLDDLGCGGTELLLINCPHNGIGNHNCGHNEDVALQCVSSTPTPFTTPTPFPVGGDLRLVDNNGITGGSSGRLEVNINGTWGTVCDDSFDSFDAEVACRQLGFSGVVNFGNVGQLGFTEGDSTQPIYLDDLGCGDTELLLINCPHNGIGNHNCGHSEDVALQCVSSTPTPFTTPTPFPVGGELRLVDNNGTTGGSSGRLEVNINGTWGTVCDDSFDSFDAEVACRQLGFSGVVNFGNVGQLGFAQGDSTQPIYLDDLGCGGTELLLINCPHNGIGNHNCGHNEDVALQCVSSTPTPFTTPTPFPVGGDLRLVDNNGIIGGSSGRLEVNINGTWGTVCDDSFDSFDAEVACRQLGFSGVVNFGNVGQLGFTQGDSTQPIYLDDLGCGGTELLLINCPHNGIGNHNCGHNEDVALQCVSSTPTPFTTPTPFPVGGDLRLVDNNGITGGSSGRLEVNINGTWGTVCDDSFDSFDAEVACRQLGFSGVVNFGNVGQLGFAQGDSTQPIYLDDLGCGGTEFLLINCPHNGIGNHNCGHSEDVALQCVSSTPTPFTTPTPFPVGGELRLVDNNGTTGGSSGRLEVNINGTWGTVCDDSFDSFDAEVACRQLGFSGVVNFGNVGQLGFAQGDSTQPIYLDDLGCGGTELLLINCPHNGIGNHNCGHNEDVALQCVSSTPTPFTTPTPFPVGGDLRLVDNNGITGGSSGRLEVNINGTWGTVCDDSFDSFDAEVACRQLGFSGVVNFGNVGQLGFTQGDSTQPIYLDDLGCGGTELLLINCPHNGIGNHNCGHNEDVALQCVSSTPTPFTTPTPFPVGGDLRLVDNNGITGGSSGRLEVNINGTWGTVCDDSFDSFDAEVACRQLGFSGVVNFGNVGQLGFAQGDSTQPIYLDDLGCGGTEFLLINCPHNGIGNHNCGHSEDVALQCVSSTPTPFITPTPFPVGGELRLVDNNGITGGSTGRLEVNINGTWGTVCDDSFDSFDAEVACRQLGFSGVVNFGNVGQLGFTEGDSTQPIYLDDLGCSGTEFLLINCPHNGIGNHNCGHSEDVALQCVSSTPTPFTTPTPFPVGGELRLVDNNGTTGGSSGRLEVNINGTWGTVCDDSFDSFDAEVACRQLGFSGVVNFGNVGQLGFTEGDSTQPIYLDDLGCGGTELLLIDCPHNGIGNHNCGHSEDVALQCVSSTPSPFTTPTPFPVGGELRLVDNNGTTGGSSGRLEVNINGTWGTVCDDSFDSFDAEVACRQLGFSGVVNFGNVGQLGFTEGDSTQPIYLDDLGCGGTELLLIDCPHNGIGNHNCGHSEDVALQCVSSTPSPFTTPTPFPVGGELRLVDNNGTTGGSSGRLEVNINGTWGTVCDDSFDSFDAEVACRQLGFSGVVNFGNVGQLGFAQGDSTQPIYLDDLGCGGTELLLINCPHNGIGNHNCGHNEDVALQCVSSTPTPFTTPTPFPFNGELRLVDNNNNTFSVSAGRLEVNINGTWGTICDDSFDSVDAQVACRQLGFSGVVTFGDVMLLGLFEGASNQPIYLDDLQCGGTEFLLIDCPNPGIGVHNCGHSEDVALECFSGSTPSTTDFPTSPPTGTCTNGQVQQLFDSTYNFTSYPVNGQLYTVFDTAFQFCYNGTYASLCDLDWDNNDAAVLCRELGYFGYVGEALSDIRNANSVHDVSVACNGSENSLSECFYTANDMCSTSDRQARVRCREVPQNCSDGSVRLANQTFDFISGVQVISGRVDVCVDGSFSAVCDSGFDDVDAAVVCNSMGYSPPFYEAEAIYGAFLNTSWDGTLSYENVMCTGREQSLSECSFSSRPTNPSCFDISSLVGVRCTQVLSQCFSDGDFISANRTNELFGPNGEYSFTARVDVCFNGTYGSVCDQGWDEDDARVFCRNELGGGMGLFSEPLGNSVNGISRAGIVLEDVRCNGTEGSIFECPTSQIGVVNSQQCQNAAAVTCSRTCYDGSLRVLDGNRYGEGRVEVCMNNAWGTICDEGWDDVDAAVACRAFQFDNGGVAVGGGVYNPGTGPIVTSGVSCTGSEFALFECRNDSVLSATCSHQRDAGVMCNPGSVDIRISPTGSAVLGSQDFRLRCDAEQRPWRSQLSLYEWSTDREGPLLTNTPQRTIDILGSSFNEIFQQFIFNGSISFNPLRVEDLGLYTCLLTVNLTYPDGPNNSSASITNTTTYTVTADAPTPFIFVNASEDITEGSPFTASCIVITSPDLLSFVSVQWIADSDVTIDPSRVTIGPLRAINETHVALDAVFSSLFLSDSGFYTCEATIGGEYLRNSTTSTTVFLDVQASTGTPPTNATAATTQFVPTNATETPTNATAATTQFVPTNATETPTNATAATTQFVPTNATETPTNATAATTQFVPTNATETPTNATAATTQFVPTNATEAPTNATAATTQFVPTNATETPTNATAATTQFVPTNATETPTNATAATTQFVPTNATETPTNATAATTQFVPTNATETPTNATIATTQFVPTNATEAPTNATAATTQFVPTNATETPTNATAATTQFVPTNATETPTNATIATTQFVPTNATETPTNATAATTQFVPTNATEAPTNATAATTQFVPTNATETPTNATAATTQFVPTNATEAPTNATAATTQFVPTNATETPTNATAATTQFVPTNATETPTNATAATTQFVPTNATEAPTNATQATTQFVPTNATEAPTNATQATTQFVPTNATAATTQPTDATTETAGTPTQTVPPRIIRPPRDNAYELGDRVNLTCFAVGSLELTYTWLRDKVMLERELEPFLVISSIGVEDRGFYQCIVTNEAGSMQSEEALVTIDGIVQYSVGIRISINQNTRRKRQEPDVLATLIDFFEGRPLGVGDIIINTVMAQNYDVTTGTATLIFTLSSPGGEFPIQGVTGALSTQLTSPEATALGFEVTTPIQRFDGCPVDNTDPRYSWPESDLSTVPVAINCPCSDQDTSLSGRQATRACSGSFSEGVQWSRPDVNPCRLSAIADRICNATFVTDVTVVADILVEVTANEEEITSEDLELIANVIINILEQYGDLSLPVQALEDYGSIIDNLLEVDVTVALEAQRDSQSSTKILDSIETVTSLLPLIDNQSKFVRSAFALAAQKVSTTDFGGLTFNSRTTIATDGSKSVNDVATSDGKSDASTSSLSLPGTLFTQLVTGESNVRINLNTFSSPTLFPPVEKTGVQLKVSSDVISATVEGLVVANLDEDAPIALTFKRDDPGMDLTEEELDTRTKCVYWDQALESGVGDWSQFGCKMAGKDKDGNVLCECTHLSSFAILLDVQPRPVDPSAELLGVEIITYIGLAVSIIALLVTIITYLMSKKLRNSEAGQMLVNMCFALLGLYVAFILSAQARSLNAHNPPQGANLCGFFSAVLHYFMLAYFFWTAAEALFLFFKLVLVTRSIRHYVYISMGICWIAPLIIIAICMGGYQYYLNENFCRPTNWPFWFGFVVPFVLIYIFNWVMFIIIMVSLCRHAASTQKVGKGSVRTVCSHLLIAAILSLMFGLGWAFGFIGTTSLPPSVYIPAQYIFSIFIGIQGVLVFILHAVRSADSRDEWRRWWYTLTCRRETYHVRRTMSLTGSSRVTQTRKNTYLSDTSTLPRDVEEGKSVPLTQHSKADEAAGELSKVLDTSYAVENTYVTGPSRGEPNLDTTIEEKIDLSEAGGNASTAL